MTDIEVPKVAAKASLRGLYGPESWAGEQTAPPGSELATVAVRNDGKVETRKALRL